MLQPFFIKLTKSCVENLSLLAEKYSDRGNDSIAIDLYNQVLKSKNVPFELFHQAMFYPSVL